jgi:hypothetical protein
MARAQQGRPWKQAIIEALRGSSEPMHYTAIAEAVVERKLKNVIGATPARTVNATIVMSIRDDADSPFERISKGVFALRDRTGQPPPKAIEVEEEETDTGLINALGMYWSREKVHWSGRPRILGQQQPGSIHVNFYEQRGVYLLHDGREVVYVGRAVDRPLGMRLKEHMVDRLGGRWDRFSWFGVHPILENGTVNTGALPRYDAAALIDTVIVTMEAVLIEGLEPRQNRKKGDDFKAVEFIQVEDPQIRKKLVDQYLEDLQKMNTGAQQD